MKISSIIEKIQNVVFWVIALVIAYFIVDLLVVLWKYLDPEGIAGFFYFTSNLRVILVALISVVTLVFLFILTFPREFTLKAFGIFFGAVIGVGIISPILNYYTTGLAFENGMYNSIQKKYRYLNQTVDYIEDGLFAKAEEYGRISYKKALAKRDKKSVFYLANKYLHSELHQQQATIEEYAATLNLGYCFLKIQDFDSAQLYLEKSINLANKHFKSSSIYTAIPFSLLAELEQQSGNYNSAYQIVKKQIGEMDGSESFDKATILGNLSIQIQYFRMIGDKISAANIVREKLAMYESWYDEPGSVRYFNILLENFELELDNNSWANANKNYGKLVSINSKKIRRSADYYRFLLAQARFYKSALHYTAEFEESNIGFWKSIYIKLRYGSIADYLNNKLNAFLEDASDKANDKFKSSSSEVFNVQSDKLDQLIDVNELTKAVQLLSEMQKQFADNKDVRIAILLKQYAFKLAYLQNRNSDVLDAFNQVESYFANVLYSSISELSIDEKESIISLNDNWQERSNSILAEIGTDTALSLLYNNVLINKGLALYSKANSYFDPNKNNWRAIQQELNNDEIAIEILRLIGQKEPNSKINYVALVLSQSNSYPKIISLGNEKEYEAMLYRMNQDREEINSLYSVQLRKSLANLNTFLPQEIKKVYFSSVGVFNQISFAGVFPDLAIQWTQVSSTKDVINMSKLQINRRPTVLAFGGLDYRENKGRSTSRVFTDKSNLFLEYTEKEVQNIKTVYAESTDIKVYTGSKGTEQSFRSEVQKDYTVAHLATHGYFDDIGVSRSYKDLMHHSGILFAQGQSIDNEVDDGVLTAYDVSTLNLKNMKLVVLSACQTARGSENPYEGVYGFQRAFKLAGVDCIISSLWNIPDKETSVFMTHFYTQLKQGKDVELAFYNTQKYMKSEQYSPDAWAGFVLLR